MTIKGLYGMRTALLSGGGRIEVICNEAFYSISWRKMKDCDTLQDKNHLGDLTS